MAQKVLHFYNWKMMMMMLNITHFPPPKAYIAPSTKKMYWTAIITLCCRQERRRAINETETMVPHEARLLKVVYQNNAKKWTEDHGCIVRQTKCLSIEEMPKKRKGVRWDQALGDQIQKRSKSTQEKRNMLNETRMRTERTNKDQLKIF